MVRKEKRLTKEFIGWVKVSEAPCQGGMRVAQNPCVFAAPIGQACGSQIDGQFIF